VAALLTHPRFSLLKTLREFFNRNKIFEPYGCCCRTTNARTFFCVTIDKPSPRTLLSSIVGFQIVSGFLSETFGDLVDNHATHKHPRVKRWLAARPRFQVHFNPTYASWLNQVEIWLNRITQQAIRRGSFHSVKELVEKIDQYVRASNTHVHPFAWTATADSIFAKVQRLCERTSGTGHYVLSP
jgi:hypothetical protein